MTHNPTTTYQQHHQGQCIRCALAVGALALVITIGCAERAAYTARSAPIRHAELMPVWHPTGPVAVGVDPYVQPERQQAVFDAALHTRNILALQVFIRNQGHRLVRLHSGQMVLELPDQSQRHPLPPHRVAHLVPGAVPAWSPSVRGDHRGEDVAMAARDDLPNKAPRVRQDGDEVIAALGFALLPRDLAQRDAARAALAARLADYEAKVFPDVTLAPGESAHGFVFFTSPSSLGLQASTLMLRLDTGKPSEALVRVPLSGLVTPRHGN